MLIKDMFKKPIDRDIKGVIVVGEGEDSNAKQELEEYVVTRELSKHFREFFDNYKKGIVGETTKTGVWISGFFGKSSSAASAPWTISLTIIRLRMPWCWQT